MPGGRAAAARALPLWFALASGCGQSGPDVDLHVVASDERASTDLAARPDAIAIDLAATADSGLPDAALEVGVPHDFARADQPPDLALPDARTPDSGLRDLRVADLRLPDLRTPDLRLPDLQTPDLRLPDLQTPDLRLPDLQTPDLQTPDLSAPDLRMPDLAPPRVSVTQHHMHASRDGLYVDPRITRAAAQTAHRDGNFAATYPGTVFGQPLFLDDGGGGKDTVFVATELDNVAAFDALTGAQRWITSLGTPVPLNMLPCGNIQPLGITSTPVLDETSRTLYVDAMTTPDNGTTKKHLIYALSADDGKVRPGWPVDVNATAVSAGVHFDSSTQNQRGALQLQGGIVYASYSGFAGDCGTYHGWVVGVEVANPAHVLAWAVPAPGGGIWGPSGMAGDGTSVYAVSGNTFGQQAWKGGEAILRFSAGPVFSGLPVDYFAPLDWAILDARDQDLGGSGVVLFHFPGNKPSEIAIAMGKDGKIYLVDRGNLGGVSAPLASVVISSIRLITAPAVATTANGSFVALSGQGVGCASGAPGDFMVAQLVPGQPPTVKVPWCGNQNGVGSPIITTTDGASEAIAWGLGAEGDQRLHGFDLETGAVIFDGGGPNDVLPYVRRYSTPMVAKGRIYVAGDNKLSVFVMP